MNGAAGEVQPLAPELKTRNLAQETRAAIELLEITLEITDNEETINQIQLQLELLRITLEVA